MALDPQLHDRLVVLDEAVAQPNATAHAMVEAVLKDEHFATADSDGSPGESEEPNGLSSLSLEAATMRPAFRELAVALRDVGTDTLRDKIKSLAIGFDGRCPLEVRALCAKKLVSKHPALLALHDLNEYISEYLSFTLMANSAGVVPARLANYSILGKMTDASIYPAEWTKFMEHLLAFNFVETDWVNSPGGLATWYSTKKGVSFVRFNMYTSKEVVENLGEFVYRILVALGAAQEVNNVRTDGFTFKSWTRLCAEHLEMTLTLPTLKL